MKLGVVGLGQAGGKIVDALLEYDQRTNCHIVHDALTVNTATADLNALEHIPADARVLIGKSQVGGQGVGGDNELGATITTEDITEIQHVIDTISVHEIDAFLLVAALGGGTGSGALPVVGRHLKQLYTEPVYGLGILPSTNEGGLYSLNAARSLQTAVRELDNLLIFDNDAHRQANESLTGGYAAINRELATRLGVLFGAGDIDTGTANPESVVDASEIINTLKGGGVSTLGYASQSLEEEDGAEAAGLLSRFKRESSTDSAGGTNRITSLVRRATLGRLTLPVEPANVSIDRGLVIVAGPSDCLNRKGIERGRTWVEEQTGCLSIRGGDYPLPESNTVAVVVLFSGISGADRLHELRSIGSEAQTTGAERTGSSDRHLESILGDDADELDSLF
ncbi:tubulin/FtsZ family protein [Haloferax volcanii]|uniref:Tubulin-like protein CetZ4 n=2 Tax=Haloferax volcanii TaxID=2246 RepID=CETZ4_HALVD|nr:tubulin/FtsZ family protein [Haloferax volcanii]D4GQ67.1 RecName: Full=Tubulin-like protein CetZ4; AltName: Full=Cell-structure-related euryarchaeota tubulin/FtsZ homolog 4 [Haloferax volcanii DS2]ADE01805.1 FtsZ family protein CetZ, type III [Haloferax volcanii DS2]ELY28675.1 cell division protein FtsZ [Haloferax volcanii DS2]MBS8120961.1 cell division protein [Haloferax volcanii]MBS8125998.1 cell division protein [Haloferax volcanii]MBS8129851.1 cell division protein [Haloferax volcanii]